ncbi:MAG TPA: hypothetical protein VJ874_00770 [Candidatus Thermoplasmatota archaeon]|nr:hypothetical protein [Candidatus Thermoplasmatota archaeon]
MSLQVACIACARTFDAVAHPGLVRCRQCEELQDFSFPSAGVTVVTLDTPGEAWA